MKSTTIKLVVMMVLLILFVPLTQTLETNPSGSLVVKENETLTIELKSEFKGQNNFTELSGKGSITQVNSSKAIFNWTPEFGLAQTSSANYLLEFSVTNSTNQTTKQVEVTVQKTNNPFNIEVLSGGGSTNTKSNFFELKTERTAVCKYDKTQKTFENMAYTALSTNSNNTLHEGTILLDNGLKTVYVTCRDQLHNKANKTMSYEVSLKPTAQITLQPPAPVREGIVKVLVTTSLPLREPPLLTYSYDGESSQTTVTMIGSGTSWSGYIVVPRVEAQRVGTFTFKGTGKNNMEGTEITSGKIFLVDTTKPDQVTSLQAISQTDRIRLEWRYLNDDSDQIEEYRVYRLVGSGGVDYVDFYKSTTNNYLYDYDVEYLESYYYKVTAVKESGAEGPLSREVFLLYEPPTQTSQSEEKLDTAMLYELELKEQIIERILLDVNEAKRRLENSNEQTIISRLGLLEEIRSKQNQIEVLRDELTNIRSESLTKQRFDTETNRIVNNARELFVSIPIRLEVIDSTTYTQSIDEPTVTKILEEYLDEEYDNSLVTQTNNLQNRIVVDVSTTLAKVVYPEDEKTYALKEQTIKSQEPLSEVVIISKTNTDLINPSRIVYDSRPAMTGNLMTWRLGSLEVFEIKYYFETTLGLEDLRETKTIVLEQQKVRDNLITGRATGVPESEDTGILIPTIILIVLLSVLVGYYTQISRREDDSGPGFISKLSNKIKHRKMQIMPKKDDSHRKLVFEEQDVKKEERDDRETPQKHQTNVEEEPEVHLEKKKEERKEHKENASLKDLEETLDGYKQRIDSTEIPAHEIKNLHEDLVRIKDLCEEIHSESLYNYAKKTKKELEETLKKIKQEKNNKKKKKSRKEKLDVKAEKGKEFVLRNGSKLSSIEELKNSLEDMSQEEYESYVNSEKNDFAKWIKEVFERKKLARKIRKAKTKEELKKIL